MSIVPAYDHSAIPDDWRPPQASGANVIVAPVRCETETVTILGEERTLPVDAATGLVLGREVEKHVARIVSIGPAARMSHPELEVGAYVVWQRDRNMGFDHQGVRLCVTSMRTHCTGCGAEQRKDEILGVWS